MKLTVMVLLSCCMLSYAAKAQKHPRWVSEPYSECSSSRELCAVGEATGLMAAEIAARNAMARIFESQVQSVTQSQTEMMQSDVDSSQHERFSQSLKVSTDYLLRGAMVKKSFIGKDSAFVLLSLDKQAMSKDLIEQMRELDVLNEEAYRQNRRSLIVQVQRNLELRSLHHRTYQFLTQKNYPASFDERKLLQWRASLRAQDVTVYVQFSQNVHAALRHLILTELMAQEYRVVEGQSKQHQWKMDVKTQTRPMHLNVKGFEKYEFSLVLSTSRADGQRVGHVELKVQETGRHLDHAFETAVPQFRQHLLRDFDKLNMDDK